jgi:putative N6-adenine-specific DNA methylase
MQLSESAQFYLIYPVGLTDLGEIELQEKFTQAFPESELKILSLDEAGILIEVKMLEGLALNHFLKTPTRILMRIAEFKVRDFPKLFQKISNIDWKPLLSGQIPAVNVSATQSRIFDSRKIEKAVQDGIADYYKQQPIKARYQEHVKKTDPAHLPEIYIRLVDDTATVSLDTTGELLHKRGDKIYTGLAPLRESLASLLLIEVMKDNEFKDKSLNLIDPMCGSGTFLIEAHDFYQANTTRSFAYEHIPLWLDFKTNGKWVKEYFSKMPSHSHPQLKHFFGFDINSEVLELTKKNAAGKDIQIERDDLFSSGHKSPDGNNIVIINPPYGIRVGSEMNITADFYKDITRAIRKKYSPLRIGMIVPKDYAFHPPVGFLLTKRAFKNGGIDVFFYVVEFR